MAELDGRSLSAGGKAATAQVRWLSGDFVSTPACAGVTGGPSRLGCGILLDERRSLVKAKAPVQRYVITIKTGAGEAPADDGYYDARRLARTSDTTTTS